MKWSVLLLSLFVASAASSQQFRVSQLHTQRQLPVAQVRCIMQDSDGYMWYGTMGGGVCRDNGYQIDVFRLDNSIVNCLMEDKHQCIWVGTAQGTYRIDKSNCHVERILAGETEKRHVWAMHCDVHGNVWIAANDVVSQLDSAGHLIAQHHSVCCDRSSDVTCLAGDDENIWIGQRAGGLCRYDAAKGKFVAQPWDNAVIPSRILADGNRLWVATWDYGVVCYDKGTGSITMQAATLGGERKQQVIDILRDSRQGIFWVTTMDDLYAYREQDGELRPIEDTSFIPDGGKILDHLYEDRNGNIWVAGFMPHTFIISPNTRRLARYEVSGMQRLTGYPLLADRVVADMPDGGSMTGGRSTGLYWIWQGRHGLALYLPESDLVLDAGGNRYGACIEKCRSGNGIWAAEDMKTLVRLRTDGQKVSSSPVVTLDGRITCIREDRHSNVWIGTNTGLYRYALLGGQLTRVADCDGAVTHIAVDDAESYYYIAGDHCLCDRAGVIDSVSDFTALTMAADGTVWTATARGDVCFLKERMLVRSDAASDGHGDAVTDLLADDSGHLWMMTDQKVKEFNPINGAMRQICTDDPFVDVSYFYRLEAIDGHHVCLNGAGAFCVIPSSAELSQTTHEQKRPMVTAVEMDDSLCIVSAQPQEIEVAATTGTLSLRLSTQEHVDADKVSFAYKLNGLQTRWTVLSPGNNVVHFSNLPKGRYTLMLKATDVYGRWGGEEESMTIYIKPHWWETWWARMLFLIGIVSLLYSMWILRRRIRQLRMLQQKRREIVLTEIELHPDELDASRIDNEFLQKAVRVIEQHLADPDYDMERMASDMCMSRMNVYRKLHALTGQTPTEFKRDLRLKKAAQMLISMPDVPIHEVAEKVGFSNAGYFTKCFRKMFGVLPTQYGRQEVVQHKKS